MTELREKGDALRRQMIGESFGRSSEEEAERGGFGSYIKIHASESCFGAVWSRPNLDLRSRSIATIMMLIALRASKELKAHVRAGLRNGLNLGEMEELAYQAIPYLGLPAASLALDAMKEVIAEDNLPT